MKTIKMMALPLTFLAAITLGGCVGAELGEESEGVVTDAAPEQETAKFKEDYIDLSKNLGDETVACVALNEDVMECYQTKAELDARIAEIGKIRGSAELRSVGGTGDQDLTSDCGTPLLLCRHSGCAIDGDGVPDNLFIYGPRRVEINLTTLIVNGTSFNFNDRLSAYKTGSCSVTFWENISNTGDSKRVTTPFYYDIYIGDSWNDRVSSIWLW